MDITTDVLGRTRVHGDELLTDGLARSVVTRQLNKNQTEGQAKFHSDRIHYSNRSPISQPDNSKTVSYDDVSKVYTFHDRPNLIMLAIDDPDDGRIYQTFRVNNASDVDRIKRHIKDHRQGRRSSSRSRSRRGYDSPGLYPYDERAYSRLSKVYRPISRSPSPIYVETLPQVQSVPVVERVGTVPVVERVETVPVVERVETVPVVERVETVPVVERDQGWEKINQFPWWNALKRFQVERVPRVERIQPVPVVERVETVPVVERVETVPVVERVERVSRAERVQPVPVVERVERLPVVERVETVPVVERIERTPVIERVQQIPTIIRERTPSPIYVTPMPQPPSTYVRPTEIYVPDPEPDPVIYRSTKREISVTPTYVERVEQIPVVERVETVPVIERVETVPVVERVVQEQQPSPVYVQTVQTRPRTVSTTNTYVRPAEVVVTEPVTEQVRYRRSSRSRYGEPTPRQRSKSPGRRSSSSRRPHSPAYGYEDRTKDGDAIVLKRVETINPT
ncbi:hypothetical protein FGIG_08018 [Fasciola gigantica]|uniref:Trematode PH-like domain-containing protein n=1 Tax=Fasciola gigantica TaxID=46835 RepID=A0A504YH61_FASGI|nr:hypothetical protein FGIG_08018 [Fasciola gigantica]